MRVVVLGGSGLLGSHAVTALRRHGHVVEAVARTTTASGVRTLDLLTCTDEELRACMRGANAVVQAFGPDDRHVHARPASKPFHEGLVSFTRRLMHAAGRESVARLVICGSYFTHLATTQGWSRRTTEQPYIRARLDQAALVLDHPQDVAVVLLELPFVFGAAPGRMPLWAPVVRYVTSPWPLVATPGGTTMIGAPDVAQGIACASEGRVAPGRYPIGERYLSWKDWLEALGRFAGRPRRATTVPGAMALPFTTALERVIRSRGFEHGVDRTLMMRRVLAGFEIDPAAQRSANAALGIEPRTLEASLEATVRSCAGPIRSGGAP